MQLELLHYGGMASKLQTDGARVNSSLPLFWLVGMTESRFAAIAEWQKSVGRSDDGSTVASTLAANAIFLALCSGSKAHVRLFFVYPWAWSREALYPKPRDNDRERAYARWRASLPKAHQGARSKAKRSPNDQSATGKGNAAFESSGQLPHGRNRCGRPDATGDSGGASRSRRRGQLRV